MPESDTTATLYENKKAKIKITYEWLQVGDRKYQIRYIEYLERDDKKPPKVPFERVLFFLLGGIVLILAPTAFDWQGTWTFFIIIAGAISLLVGLQTLFDPGKGTYQISVTTVGGKVFEHKLDDEKEMDKLQQALEKAIAQNKREDGEG
jgi:hypothetical protein